MGTSDGAHDVITISARLRPDQVERLKALSKQTQIPQAVMLRKAVDDYLAKNINLLDSISIDEAA